jgi:CheY-like chemotaxis protein
MMSDTTSPSGKLALIVEDDADCAELLKVILEDENWRAECVEFGSEALRVEPYIDLKVIRADFFKCKRSDQGTRLARRH